MFAVLENVLTMIVTLGVLITFHEWGHFQVARWCGVGVVRFSVGFGPALLKWTDKKGTEFVLAAIPLGGFVKMIDEREGDVSADKLPLAFNRKSVWKRIAIVAAGPLANFILAIVVFWGIYQGGVTKVAPIVGAVAENSIAAEAGLEKGQEIVAVDMQSTRSWGDVNMQLIKRLGESGPLVISVKYPESNLTYDNTVWLDQWLKGAEEPDPLQGLGIQTWRPEVLPLLASIEPGSPAEKAGLLPGDLLTALDDVVVRDWYELVDYVQIRPETEMTVSFKRDGVLQQVLLTTVTAKNKKGEEVGRIGISPVAPEYPKDMLRKLDYGVISAFVPAVNETWRLSGYTLMSFGKLIKGEISTKNLSGPITIAKVATSQARSGLLSWLNFLAFLSISLGVINLLPVPVLDGGHLLFYSIEAVLGRPLPEKIQLVGFQVGMFIVVSMMMLAIYYDVLRLVK